MSHRRPGPGQVPHERTLRSALRMAADSMEPAADGLDQIRSKIAAGPPAPFQLSSWALWRSRYLPLLPRLPGVPGLLAALSAAARYLEPAGIKLRYAYGAVMERFRPDARTPGGSRWPRLGRRAGHHVG
jgi:hypothetical protein